MILPLYFALHIAISSKSSFYHPSPRAINVWAAQALPAGLLLAYLVPMISSLRDGSQAETQDAPTVQYIWPAAHILFPTVVFFARRVFRRISPAYTVGQLLYGAHDLLHLHRFYILVGFATSVSHLVVASRVLQPAARGEMLGFLSEWIQLGCLTLSIMTWSLFVVWDLRRVNVDGPSLSSVLVMSVVGSVLAGPAAVLVALWVWRESALHMAGRRPEVSHRGQNGQLSY